MTKGQRWVLTTCLWTAWKHRQLGVVVLGYVNPQLAEDRAARLLRFWARRCAS